MVLGIIIAVIALLAVLGACGFSRLSLPRKLGIEGIEDPAVARAYDRITRWPQFRALRRMIVGRLARHHPAGTLVDIGCGPGRLTTLVARKLPHLHVVGIDTAQDMVRAAAANASSLGLSGRVEYREGDVSNLPVADGTVDFAVSTLSLHHWSDPSRGLAEIYRALKAGGQLLLFDLRRDPRRFFYWLLRFAQSVVVPAPLRRIDEPLGSLLSSYSLAELNGLLAQSPFKEWRIEGGHGWVFVWASKGPEGG